MMGYTDIPTIEPISVANEPQVKRVRKRLLFIDGICLVSFIAYLNYLRNDRMPLFEYLYFGIILRSFRCKHATRLIEVPFG
jgi:hypothetical protein